MSVSLLSFGLASSFSAASKKQQPPPPPPQNGFGAPLASLTATERAAFDQGRMAFGLREDPTTGLGPVFNGDSCQQCHNAGAPGGAGNDPILSRVTRIGAIRNGVYSDLADLGGPVLQRRSLREINPNYPHTGEVVPAGAQFVSRRVTTPLFGLGLIEAIPDSTILTRAAAVLPDGIKGVANLVVNPENGRTEVGKFGWKAQTSRISVFSADAYLNEMGVTTPLFPKENLPQGRPIAPGADLVGDPEDRVDAGRFTNFMKFLGAPPTRTLTANALRGRTVFSNLGCNHCHTPSMNTGFNPSAALSNKTVSLYSDLLLHKMGTGLADGIVQGKATGDMFRTAPLWGLSVRRLLMHDGRATTIDQAILLHGGEALPSRQRFSAASTIDRGALNEFLNSL
ncbi:MAG TPA: di-heme oxidoredictase family protein [Fimbriimonas sp.]|nr:di-heme oxidoredictase family protein [Fimbriimonas sp.]